MPAGSPASRGSAAVNVWRQGLTIGSAPPVVWLPAALVAGAMLLPLAYLVYRAAGAGGDVWGLLLRERSWQTLGRTVLLTGAVTAASATVALPLAWLTARTDLPHRRMWTVITALPLVIPSYVAAFVVVVALGPRGMFQQLLEAAFGIERIPPIYGFPGAMITIALLSYPYMLLPVRAALIGMDRTFEENARDAGRRPLDSVPPRDFAPASSRNRGGRAAGRAVYAQRLRRRIHASVRDDDVGDLRTIRVGFRPLRGGGIFSCSGSFGGRHFGSRIGNSRARRSSPHRRRVPPLAQPSAARTVEVAGLDILRGGNVDGSRNSNLDIDHMARAWAACRGRADSALGLAGQLHACVQPGGGCDDRPGDSAGRWR